jgi:hypothetical protein
MKRTSLKNLRLLACLGVSIACLAAGRAWGDEVRYVSDGSAFSNGSAPTGTATYGFVQAKSGGVFKPTSSSAAPGGGRPSGENASIGPDGYHIVGGPSENSPDGAESNSDTKDKRSPPSNDKSTNSPDSTTPESPASDTSTPDFGSSDSGLTRCPTTGCVNGEPPKDKPEPPTCTDPALKCCVADQPDWCATSLFNCKCP